MKLPVISLLVLFGAAHSTMAAPGANHAASSADRGRFYVLRSCAGCHAVGQTGASPDSHAPPFPVVRGSVTAGQLTMMLRELSKNGHYEMPPIFMSEADIRDIGAYVATLQRPKSPRRVRKINFATGSAPGIAKASPN